MFLCNICGIYILHIHLCRYDTESTVVSDTESTVVSSIRLPYKPMYTNIALYFAYFSFMFSAQNVAKYTKVVARLEHIFSPAVRLPVLLLIFLP